MMRKAVLVAVVIAALTVGIFAASSNAQKSAVVTVGDFALKVAKALGYAADSQQGAVKSLKKSGVDLEATDLSARLTEGKAAGILNDLGIRVSNVNPGSAISPDKADRLAAQVGLTSSVSAPTPSDGGIPTECLTLKTRGDCQDCCKAFFGCAPSPALCDFASYCAKTICRQVLPPGQVSSPEPQP
jgi:hypothetical protein